MKAGSRSSFRETVARLFSTVEDTVYVGLGLLLAAGLAAIDAALAFWRTFAGGLSSMNLYTVQVSFREHLLVPEPFLLVALIASVRRIIVLTAELGELARKGGEAFRLA